MDQDRDRDARGVSIGSRPAPDARAMTLEAPRRAVAATVAGNAAALVLSRVFASALLLVWQIVLGRTLGTAAYGIYGTIGAMMAVGGALADFGTGTIVVRDVARRTTDASRYLAASLAVQSALAVVGYLVLQAGAAALGYDATLRALLLFVGINLVVDVVGTAAHNQLVASERMWWAGAATAAHVVLLVALGVTALAAGGGLWAVYAAMLAAGIGRGVLYWAALKENVPHAARLTRPDLLLIRQLLSAAAPLGIAAIQALAFLHADKLVTTALLGTDATGQLTAAFVIVFGIVELLGTTALVAALPPMSRDERNHDLSTRQPMLESLLYFILLVGVPASMLIARFGPDLVALLYGPAFGGAGTVLRLMGWWVVVRMLEGALAQALTVRDRQRQVLAARATGLALNLGLTLILLPRIGISGAAIGMLGGELTIVMALLGLLAPPRGWWIRVGLSAARLAMPTLALALALLLLPPLLPYAAAGAAGLLVYVAVAIAGGAVTRAHLRVVLDVARLRSAS
jgi:O-antigen/teichoic acid export membrane protein